MSPTVSNGPNSNNADYVPATATIGGEEYQKMIPCDATGTPITPVTTQDVNLTMVSGDVISMGQQSESFSLPVALAFEQDSVETWTDDFSNTRYMTVVGGREGTNNTVPLQLNGTGELLVSAAVTIPSIGGTPAAIALNTATLTQILAANASRKYAYVYNPGIYEIGLRLSTNTTSPTINSIRIPAQTSWSSDLYEWQGPIYAISYTTSFSCHVSEQT